MIVIKLLECMRLSNIYWNGILSCLRERNQLLGLPCGSKRHFINIHGSEGKEAWEVMGKVLKEKYPEMTDAFRKYEKQTSGYFYNMCIMKNQISIDIMNGYLIFYFKLKKKLMSIVIQSIINGCLVSFQSVC